MKYTRPGSALALAAMTTVAWAGGGGVIMIDGFESGYLSGW